MSKKLDATAMMNELQGSAFFSRPTPPRAPAVPKEQPQAIEVQKTVVQPKERTTEPNDRTERTNERSDRTLLHELQQGIQDDVRATERYSFEIYTDQKARIEDVQYRYKKRTGKKLSASRIIREALEDYLKKAERVL